MTSNNFFDKFHVMGGTVCKNSKSFYHDRVERILIKPGNENYRAIARACQITRRIKNRTHYLLRHSEKLFGAKRNHRSIDQHLKQNERELYTKHPSSVAQRTTQICGAEWSSFFESIKSYKRSPEKYKAAPRPPKYSKGAATTYIGRNGFSIIEGKIQFPKMMGLSAIVTTVCQQQVHNVNKKKVAVKEIRFVPLGNSFAVEIVYDQSALFAEGYFCPVLDKSRVLSIDIGLTNLASLVSNQPDLHPVLINGDIIKSVNAKYKAEQIGIDVRIREESYTSKASALDLDFIPSYNKKTPSNVMPLFSGKRTKRGLYRTSKGQYINSDINGAINIMRKELGDEVLPPLANWGCVFQPVRVSLHRYDAPKVIRTKRITTQAQPIAA